MSAKRLLVRSSASVIVLAYTLGFSAAHAATFIFSNAGDVTHAANPVGSGGVVNITVGVLSSTFTKLGGYSSALMTSVENAVNTWSALVPTVGNVLSYGASGLAATEYDFESVMLHEIGHALGLGHTNLSLDSGVTGAASDAANSNSGANGKYDLNPGLDGVYGSADDQRGDDGNLNYFNVATNDPFDVNLGVVDSTTYSKDINYLPTGDTYTAIASREVAALLGYGNTEAVMTQGTYAGETQRDLAADDVVGLLYAQSGVDQLAGTADDYVLNLNFVGEVANASDVSIAIQANNSATGFANAVSSGAYVSGASQVYITSSLISFNTNYDWFYNSVSNAVPVPLPAPVLMLGAGLVALGGLRRSRR